MICPKCNANLPDGTTFCPTCGQNLAAAAAPVYSAAPTYAAPRKDSIVSKLFANPVTMIMTILALVWIAMDFLGIITCFESNGIWIFQNILNWFGSLAYDALISFFAITVVYNMINKKDK